MRTERRTGGVIVLAAILLGLEWATRGGLFPPAYVPPPSSIFVSLVGGLVSGELIRHLLITSQRFVVGYTVASLLGIPLGLALGRWSLLHAVLEPLIEFFRPIPVVAILPIAMFVLGLGNIMAYAVIAFGSGWIVLLHTMDGVRGVDPVLVDTGRTFGTRGAKMFWAIMLPAAAPQIFTGLRVSLAISLILAIVIELIVGFGGLGAFIGTSYGALRVPDTYAGIVLVGILGYVMSRLFLLVEGRVMAWHRGSTAR